MRIRIHIPIIVVLLFGLAAGTSPAATHRVPSEYATINAALDGCAFGDTVLVAPGTYTDWEHRDGLGNGSSACAFLVDGVVLRSEGGSAVTTIDMQGQSIGYPYVIRAADLPSEATTVEGFTIRGVPYPGNGVGIAYCGRVTVRDCHFADVGGDSPRTGGSTIRSRFTDIEVTDCTFENCSAQTGGAIGQLVGDVVIRNCQFIDCTNNAVYLNGSSDPNHSAEIVACVFRGNQSDFGGGALAIEWFANGVSVSDCLFENNMASAGRGGALLINDFSRPTSIDGCVFLNNHLEGFGNGGTIGIGLVSGDVSIAGNTFYGSSQEPEFGGATIDIIGQPLLNLSHNIIASSVSGSAAVYTGALAQSSCNVFWDNEHDDADGFELDPTDRVIDPLFCDPDSGDLTVSSESPCLPANSLGCGLIGALGQGCGVVSIAPHSWGSIKSMYR
jgi:hypothetical protein